MKRILISKMLRKLMVLSCLVVGLVFVTSNTAEFKAFAATDCSNCLDQARFDYEQCDAACPPVASCQYACLVAYQDAQNACYEQCP